MIKVKTLTGEPRLHSIAYHVVSHSVRQQDQCCPINMYVLPLELVSWRAAKSGPGTAIVPGTCAREQQPCLPILIACHSDSHCTQCMAPSVSDLCLLGLPQTHTMHVHPPRLVMHFIAERSAAGCNCATPLAWTHTCHPHMPPTPADQ
jgi:hypothetical protein